VLRAHPDANIYRDYSLSQGEVISRVDDRTFLST
jgi:hypothetical protein